MKNLKHVFLVTCLILTSVLQAQEGRKSPRIEELHTKKWQFIVTQAQLSPDEIDKVHLVFLNYEKSVWEMHQQNREYFKNALQNKEKVKPNYTALNDSYVESEFKEAQLFKNYHLQLRKLLQAETLFNYYKAEREFKRKLVQDFQGKRSQDQQKPQ